MLTVPDAFEKIACGADTADRSITMSSLDLTRLRFSRLSRNQVRLNAGRRPLAATDLGTDLGDRFFAAVGAAEVDAGRASFDLALFSSSL